ncbi:MAG: biotin/lipoyl-containing protein [Planctomycetota bacterium]
MTLKKTFVRDGEPVDVSVSLDAERRARARVGTQAYDVEYQALPGGGVRLVVDGVACDAFLATRGQRLQVRLAGTTYELEIARGRGAAAAAGSGVVEAPMTGTVLDVMVAVGDAVAAEQHVAVLSAMKMEHKLVAGVAGVVREVRCQAGDLVDQGQVLVRVEPTPRE